MPARIMPRRTRLGPRAAALLTRLANHYWRRARGRVPLAELVADGEAEIRETARYCDPRSASFVDYVAPRLHRALAARIAPTLPPPWAPPGGWDLG
jgi:hypothetical protein